MSPLIRATGIWTSRSALHCGGSEERSLSGFDMVLVRDGDERPFIPAASLIGAAWSYAGKYLMPAAKYEASDQNDRQGYDEPAPLRLLFGSRAEYASFLSADDATLMDKILPGRRDGVRIDPRNGLAWTDSEGGAKYECEILPAGSRFPLVFEVRLPDPLPGQVTESRILSAFGVVLRGFASGEIRLGARTSQAMGRVPWKAGRSERSGRLAITSPGSAGRRTPAKFSRSTVSLPIRTAGGAASRSRRHSG